MKEYLKQYLLPKEFGGKNYNCSICKKDFIVRKDSKSGNRCTLSICSKCKYNLTIINNYGSLEAYSKVLSNRAKNRVITEEYREKISKSVKDNWANGLMDSVSKSVANNWKEKSIEQKKLKSENIKKGLKEGNKFRQENISSKREELEKELNTHLLSFSEGAFKYELDPSLTTIEKYVKILDLKVYKIANLSLLKEDDFLKIKEETKPLNFSNKEKELVNYIKSIYDGEVVENDRGVLNGKELDIYLPEKNLAIEFNGLYWHSDTIGLKKGEIPSKSARLYAKHRHLEKTNACKEKGVRLIHIFEDDWDLRSEVVKSILYLQLSPPKEKIFARKCIIKELDSKTYRNFLETNHLQGYSPANIRLGLFYKDKLVECIGVKKGGTHSKEDELVRLCTIPYTRVLGGFSKLLKACNVNKLYSYVDAATFNGFGYEKSGFTVDKINPPVYFYTMQSQRFPRNRFMRKNIENMYNQNKLKYWNPNETEEVNMYKNGFGKIWNCGTIRVKYENKENN